jgi:glycosyltransferase involved in cell wall biosynthesis
LYIVRVRDHTMIAHSLPDPFFGPAANLHGATFVVDAEFRARRLNALNIVIDIGMAQQCLRKVLKSMDFSNLDGEARFAGQLTTTEFLAKYIHNELSRLLAGEFQGELKVTLNESHISSAGYEGPVVQAPLRRVSALMPLIHDRLTGGSLFNRKILDRIDKAAGVDLHLEGESLLDGQWTPGIWLVDSLCLPLGATHLVRNPSAAGIVIAHYLKLIDPRYRHSPQADAERDALRAYKAVVVTSQFARKALMENGLHGQVEVVRPGLEASYRRPVPQRLSAANRILTIGSLFPDKGLVEMVSILENMRDLNWSWEIVGDAELDVGFAAELHHRLSESPIGERVTLLGALPPHQVEDAYDRADIFALPSRFETCSMVTMEAMARGLPVVAFRVGGIPELLPDRFRQQLADAGDLDRFTAILRSLLADRGLRLALGDGNRVAGEKFPAWDDAAAQVLDLIGDLGVQA